MPPVPRFIHSRLRLCKVISQDALNEVYAMVTREKCIFTSFNDANTACLLFSALFTLVCFISRWNAPSIADVIFIFSLYTSSLSCLRIKYHTFIIEIILYVINIVRLFVDYFLLVYFSKIIFINFIFEILLHLFVVRFWRFNV